MNWITQGENPNAKKLSRSTGIDAVVINVLLNRGLTEKDIFDIFLEPQNCLLNPKALTNALKAAQKILYFIQAHPQDGLIVVFGDYDVDGITSGYIMSQVLLDLYENVFIYYPNRTEGYGLNLNFCKRVVERDDFKHKMVITVDNGVAAVEEVAYLVEHGVEVIVTDHHEPKEVLPDCLIVNPFVHQDESFKHLAGCGVAFKVCQAIQELAGLDSMYYYTHALTIGTIADMMPMTKENLALCMSGKAYMDSKECPTPLKAFKRYFGKNEISYVDIGWEIAPMINACGRMGDTLFGSRLLFDADLTTEQALEEVIVGMVRINDERKALTKQEAERAFKTLDPTQNVLIHVIEDCPEGIVGIIANQLINRYNKPCIVLSKHKDTYKGSGRGTSAYSILELLKLEYEKEHLLGYGGHSAAAGVSLKDLETFKSSVQKSFLSLEPMTLDKNQVRYTDGILTIKDLNHNLFRTIHMIPYDKDYLTEPIFEWHVEVESCVPAKNDPNNGWITIKDETGKTRYWAKSIYKLWVESGSPKQARIIGSLKKGFGVSEGKIIIDILDIKDRTTNEYECKR